MKHTILLFFLTICLVSPAVNGQINERVYLQTDKQLYLAGELLWMKMYTTDIKGQLLSLSKIGYVELIHDSIPEIQVSIDILDGTGAGWMELPAMLPTGYYRMIAYTRYMRNEGEKVYFEKIICIVNPFTQNNDLYTEETNTSILFNPIEKVVNQVDLSVDKQVYTQRDKGEIRLKGLPADHIALGISIAGLDPSLEATSTIVDWKKQLSGESVPLLNRQFLPEYEGAIIDGVLIDLETGNPADASNVLSLLTFPGKEIQLFAGQGDTNGNVSFYTHCVAGKHELTTTAYNLSSKKYRVDIRSPYAMHTSVHLPSFNPDSTWLGYIQNRNIAIQVTHAYMADSLSSIKEIASCSNFRPHDRFKLDEYTRFPNMEEVFIEFIDYARIRRTNEGRRLSIMTEGLVNFTNNVLLLLDNIPITDHELICGYNPLLINTIDLHIGRYLFGGYLFDGIISFFTYQNDYPGVTFDASTQLFDYEGTQPYRYFYTPFYNDENRDLRVPDFRHTLLWEPSIYSDGQSELVIPFTTSDLQGSYLITIEGIGANGTTVYARQIIEVE